MSSPSHPKILERSRAARMVVLAVGVMALWLAFVQKLQRLEFQLPPLGLLFVIAGVFSLGALVAVALLARRKQITWPLALLLVSWGWFFARDLANGDVVLGILLGGSIVVGSYFASSLGANSLWREYLTFPVGFLVAGLIVTAITPSGSIRSDGSSGFLGAFPFGQYMGFAGHPNHLGPVMVMGILIILSQRKPPVWAWGLLALFAAALVASGSDGSIGALAISLVFVAVFHDKAFIEEGKLRWKTIAAASVAVVLVIWSIVLVSQTSLGSFTTGRTTIWSNYVDTAFAAGLFGFGHFPDRETNPAFNDITRTFLEPHSIWLSSQVTGGFIGSALHLAFWVSVLIAVSKLPNSTEKILAIGLTVFLLVYGSVETLLSTGFRVYYPAFGLLVALLIPQHLREQSRRQMRG